MVTMLDLNTLQRVYFPFERWSYIDGMPKLRKRGLEPITVSDLMERRLEVLSLDENHPEKDALTDAWLSKSYDTASGVAYFKDEIKIVPNAQILKEKIQGSKLSMFGALVLIPEEYSDLEGWVFTREDLEREGAYLIWKALVEGDQYLLGNHNKAVSALSDHEENMRVWLELPTQERPLMHSWLMGGLPYRCDAFGTATLGDRGNHYAHLVGMWPGDTTLTLLENLLEKIVLDERV